MLETSRLTQINMLIYLNECRNLQLLLPCYLVCFDIRVHDNRIEKGIK